jgi:serine/threonine protein kinase
MLGRGSFGVVTADGADGAVKQMHASESARDCIPHTSVREVAALAALSGAPHIPTPLSMEAHESGMVHVQMQRLAITVMEEQESRPQLARRRTAQEIRRVLEDVGAALAQAHARGIAHRDIKLENIMMDKRRRHFLIDWGLCCFRDGGGAAGAAGAAGAGAGARRTADVGTPIYRSPEAASGPYDVFAADVWALAVSCVELFMGRHPYHAKQNRVLLEQIRASFAFSDDYIASLKNGPAYSVHSALRAIEMRDSLLGATLRGMLHLEAAKRSSMRAVMAAIAPAVVGAAEAPVLPAPPLPAFGRVRATGPILRAHGWITELAHSWALSERAHDVAQWCFASSMRKEWTDEDVSKRAAVILVLCSKAFCSNSRLTSSAQRVCTEQHATVRMSDRLVSKEFRKLEAEMLCLMGGKLFFRGIAERTMIKAAQCHMDPAAAKLATFFAHIAVIRCGWLFVDSPSGIIQKCIELAQFVHSSGKQGAYPEECERLISYAKIEMDTYGPIATFAKFVCNNAHTKTIQAMAEHTHTIVVSVTDADTDADTNANTDADTDADNNSDADYDAEDSDESAGASAGARAGTSAGASAGAKAGAKAGASAGAKAGPGAAMRV